jgi:hypothetical protein
MAQPAHLKWDYYQWRSTIDASARRNPNEERTNQSTDDWKFATVSVAQLISLPEESLPERFLITGGAIVHTSSIWFQP